MATTSSPLPGGLYTCLVGSATETDQSRQQRNNTDDPYNRQGELCSFQVSPSRIKCRVLDGHRTARMRSTVSCVIHSDNNSAFIAGGYDGRVTVWSDDKLGLLARFGGGAATINAIVADAKTYGVLYGTSTGELVWCPDPLSVDESGRTRLRAICAPAQVPQGQALPLANAVDVLVMTSKAASPVACAGFGYLSSPYRGGIVQCYDMTTQSLSCCIKVDTQSRCLTDIALHPDERILAIGTGILVDGKALRGDGRIRLRDFRRPTDNAADDLPTQQMDVHRLAFSPSNPSWLFSNDASTGLMLVHDLRYGKRALWSHTHSTSSSSADSHEHYQGFAWCPSTGALLTGGNDGLLKVWDLASADPLKESHDIGQPVNNITLSPDATNLWVGTEYGAVHMLSRNPSLQDAFRDNITVAYDPIQQ
jgi:WD40 repeat protein